MFINGNSLPLHPFDCFFCCLPAHDNAQPAWRNFLYRYDLPAQQWHHGLMQRTVSGDMRTAPTALLAVVGFLLLRPTQSKTPPDFVGGLPGDSTAVSGPYIHHPFPTTASRAKPFSPQQTRRLAVPSPTLLAHTILRLDAGHASTLPPSLRGADRTVDTTYGLVSRLRWQHSF